MVRVQVACAGRRQDLRPAGQAGKQRAASLSSAWRACFEKLMGQDCGGNTTRDCSLGSGGSGGCAGMTGIESAGSLPNVPSTVRVGGATGRFESITLPSSVATLASPLSIATSSSSVGGGSTEGVPGFGMPVTEPPAASGWGRPSSPVCCVGAVVLSVPHAASIRQTQRIARG